MQSSFGQEFENTLGPAQINGAVQALNHVIKVVAAGPIKISQADPNYRPYRCGWRWDVAGIVIWLSESELVVEVPHLVRGDSYARFSCCEMRYFRAAPLPQTVEGFISRMRTWILEIGAPTDPKVIEERRVKEQEAVYIAVSAATAGDPEWQHLVLGRTLGMAVKLDVLCSEVLGTYTSSKCEYEPDALPMSPALAKALAEYPDFSRIAEKVNGHNRSLGILFWPPLGNIEDNRLDTVAIIRAINFAKQNDYWLPFRSS